VASQSAAELSQRRNTEWPLVTIVTPSYNQGRFIRDTIESVLSQTYPNIEYIVIDALSTDETATVCAEYAGRLTFISEKDSGQSDAINKGFRLAKGEFVAWLNSDDIFLPGAIERAVDAFEQEPELGAVYGEGYQIDIDGKVKQRFEVTEPFNLWKLVYLSDYILQQTVFFRRAVFAEVGFVDEALYYGMDWEILIRIGKRYMLRYLPYYMGSIREHGEAKTTVGGVKRFRELAAIMRRHGRWRYPPGYFVYGLDTYSRVLNHFIGVWIGRRFARVGRKLQHLVAGYAHRIIGRVARTAQGLYSDGWAARRLRYMLPPGNGRFLQIDVSLPDGIVERQRLGIWAGGRSIASEAFGPGDYRLFVRVPEEFWGTWFEFEIRAARGRRAGRSSGDERELCYILRDITYSKRSVAMGVRANGLAQAHGENGRLKGLATSAGS
jgi:glycosyltransferase involved in cell wall biosynthesis